MPISEIFIPGKVKVGYNHRKDTYSGKLAYVIYYDNKGVLRKEKSWQSWRDEKIAPDDYDNKPQEGFVLHKDIRRFNWSHFGSGRSMIRVYDPRGIEFEITPENLIGILMETNCSKRALEGEFVYAWKGTEILLLPTGSEEYQNAKKYTELQGQKVSAKTLKEGCSYTTKKGDEVVYLGRFLWYTWHSYDKRTSQKQHIFWSPDSRANPKYLPEVDYDDDGEEIIVEKKPTGSFFSKNDATFLATCNSPDPVINFADLIEQFKADIHSSNIVDWDLKPTKVSMKLKSGSDKQLEKAFYFKRTKNKITSYHVNAEYGYTQDPLTREWTAFLKGFRFYPYQHLNTDTLQISWDEGRFGGSYRYNLFTAEEIEPKLKELYDLSAVMESGKKYRIKGDLSDLQDR